MRRFASLRRRSDFNRLRQRGRRVNTPSLTLYHSDAFAGDQTSLVGITVSSSIGNAVIRNRVRRRLASIVHDALDGHRTMRLLLIARPLAATASFETLRSDVTSALAHK